MKAVVMAGGEGSRLRPITANRPKPLVPIANRPIIEHIFELLKRHGITEIVTTLHYLADEIQTTYGDGRELGLDIRYSVEDTPLGTAGSVKQAERWLRDGTFIIISGDALTDCDLTEALRFHREKGSLATIVLKRVPNPLEFGVVITDDDGRVQRFLEKPSWSEVFSDTVNTGIYILEPEIFAAMDSRRNYDWSQNIFPQLLREGKPLYGFVMEGYWADVGSLSQYRDVQEQLLNGEVQLPVPGTEWKPGIWIGDHCEIDPTAVLTPPISLGNGCKLKANVQLGPATVIGDNAFVEEGAVIERCVLWDSAYIGPNVVMRSAIAGSRVTVKRDSVIQEEAVIGDRCLIDVGCTIRARVKLWPDKMIERGSTLTMSLIWGNKWRGTLFRDLGVAGLSNIEITPEFATRLGSAFGSCLPPQSKVVTSRDSTRSSRMIKRAIIASLLSVGCDVLDLRSAPVPIARHFIKASGATGAINVRKLPGNSRVTLLELFDSTGGYLERSVERKVETTFFREDFKRTDPDHLGVIEFASRAIEEYTADFFRELGPTEPQSRKLRIVCDYGYSALASILPPMLDRLGVESISLNTFNNAKMAPRTQEEQDYHIANVRHIAETLGYDLGVMFTNEGERLTVVDNLGRVLEGNVLAGVIASLMGQTRSDTHLAVAVTAPARLTRYLESHNVRVERAKADTPSLMRTALTHGATLAADHAGGFGFPSFHAGFDGAFALANLIALLHRTQAVVSELVDHLPKFTVLHEEIPCEWDDKGAVMRQLAEKHANDDPDLTDGIRLVDGEDWVLGLPDAMEPTFHIYAEGANAEDAQARLHRFRAEVAELIAVESESRR